MYALKDPAEVKDSDNEQVNLAEGAAGRKSQAQVTGLYPGATARGEAGSTDKNEPEPRYGREVQEEQSTGRGRGGAQAPSMGMVGKAHSGSQAGRLQMQRQGLGGPWIKV